MKYFLFLLMALVLILLTSLCEAQNIDLSKAVIVSTSSQSILKKASQTLHEETAKRTRLRLKVSSSMPLNDVVAIVLGTVNDFPDTSFKQVEGFEVPAKAEGFAIWVDTKTRKAPTICLMGRDSRGALYAVGKLLRTLTMGRDKLSFDSDIRIATAPDVSIRGHQQAYRPKTNSYDGWTVEMWEQSIRDLAVFGTNAIELLPPRSDDAEDSPHYPLPKIEMMIEMSRICDEYGLDVWIWFPAIDKDYTNPKTVEAALDEWGEVFRRLPRIDAVFVPGGDPGRTHPKILMPFIEKQKKNLNKYHPNAKMWMSPQGFDRDKQRQGWMQAFYDIMNNEQPKWLDGIVHGPQIRQDLQELRGNIPAQYPIRRYPDITHSLGCQYPVPNWDKAYQLTLHREPINPRPMGFADIYRKYLPYAVGYITYSEGCNDDVNKILWSCLGWDPDMDVREIMKDYSNYFISPRYTERFADGLLALERNWQGPLLKNDSVYKTLEHFQKMEKEATPQEKLNWRFQQGLYRAYYDAYVRSRLLYETKLEKRAILTLSRASQIGALEAMAKAEAILDEVNSHDPQPQWRTRIFELAEALFQSIRMQLSVEKYQAISVRRGANLDNIDVPLNNSKELKKQFAEIRNLKTEKERLSRIATLAGTD